MRSKIKRNIILALIFTVIIYISLAFYSDFDLVVSSLEKFRWQYFPLILLIIYVSFILKFLKWQYYLSLLQIHLKLSTSFHIFMSSLTMSVTPGKIGELLKSYMIQEVDKTSLSRTIPIVFAERVTEFAALLFIVTIGLKIIHVNVFLIVVSLFLFFIVLLLVLNKKMSELFVKKLHYFNLINKFVEPINLSLNNSRVLLQFKPFVLMFVLSIFIWLIEALGFYLIIFGYNELLAIMTSFFTYLFSVLIGSLAVIPAGLGITDGSISFMLMKEGVKNEVAVSVALLIRISTLWFSLLIGTISLLKFRTILKKID